MKKLFTYCFLFLTIPILHAQDNPLWMRYPSISPDGQSIVFTYKGDLYKVATKGGTAIPLTLHEAHDYMPVWSPDGTRIAFASNRYGNFDVFSISATGGKAERLTFHSAGDYPSDFSKDGSAVLFTSSRLDVASNQQFPSGVLPELYQVPIKGGKIHQMITTPAQGTRYNSDGSMIVFHDRKGYEDEFRKHHTSSVTRDIWSYDIKNDVYKKLSTFNGEDRNPVFGKDDQTIFYLSEQNGDFNIFKTSLSSEAAAEQITQYEKHPVRYLSISNDGLMCYSFNGEIYTFAEGAEAKKVDISLMADERYNEEKIKPIKGDITEMVVSPNGKEFAYIVRGEVFVSSVKEGTTKRITNTPQQERSVAFHPESRALLYASERDGSWNLYQSKISREEEKYFFNATIIEEETILKSEFETFQGSYSPDGKEVAFLEERTALKVINLATKEVREIMAKEKQYSYSDGDQHYEWSPDGKWFFVNFLQENQWIDQAGLVSSSGDGEIVNLTKSGYGSYSPKWMMDGKMMLYFSDRDGMKNHASWGGQLDIYAMFMTPEDYDEFKLNEEEYELAKEASSDEEKSDKTEEKKDSEVEKKDKKIEPIKIDLDGIEDRKSRLSIHSSSLADAYVTKDGKKLLYLARFEKGYDLWQTNLRTRETKILVKFGAKSRGSIIPSKDDKDLFILSDGKVTKVTIEKGEKKGINIKGEMVLNETEERAYLFEHIWRQVEKKFYKKDLHGIEWEFYKKEYAKFLPHINNNYDFAEMLSELLGELNASHTGARYRPQNETGDQTASLGLFYDQNHNAPGLLISEVMPKSPVAKSSSKIKAGIIIEKIDGQTIEATTNHFKLLNRKSKKNTLLSLFNPTSGERWEETVKPISLRDESQLRYKRWVKNCEKMVDELSEGKVGYVHVRSMNDRSFRTVYENVLGKNANKESLIVDTRFNGGGWLHDDLATFLNGLEYITMMPRGQNLGSEPQFKWRKPSAVVMSESNYSDAHMFPYTYKTLGIGKLIGMPVPGTGTAVWWERLQNGMVFGIPQVGMVDVQGDYLENKQLEPDIKVANDPGKVSKGIDQQLAAAVIELLKTKKRKIP